MISKREWIDIASASRDRICVHSSSGQSCLQQGIRSLSPEHLKTRHSRDPPHRIYVFIPLSWLRLEEIVRFKVNPTLCDSVWEVDLEILRWEILSILGQIVGPKVVTLLACSTVSGVSWTMAFKVGNFFSRGRVRPPSPPPTSIRTVSGGNSPHGKSTRNHGMGKTVTTTEGTRVPATSPEIPTVPSPLMARLNSSHRPGYDFTQSK